MKVKNFIYAIMTLSLAILIIPMNVFAEDTITSSQSTEFEVLPKLTGGTPQASGGMDLDVHGTFTPKAIAENGVLLYDAIDKIVLSDLTGKWEGWKLIAEATPLKNKDYEFPRGSLSIVEPSSINPLSGQDHLPSLSYKDKVILDDGQVMIAKAEKDTGMGDFEFKFENASLLLAANENASYEDKPKGGTYQTTINWNLVSANGEVKVLRSDDYQIEVDSDYLYDGLKKPAKEENVAPNKSVISKIPLVNKLPQTGSEAKNFIFVGLMFIAAAISLLFIRKKKSKDK